MKKYDDYREREELIKSIIEWTAAALIWLFMVIGTGLVVFG